MSFAEELGSSTVDPHITGRHPLMRPGRCDELTVDEVIHDAAVTVKEIREDIGRFARASWRKQWGCCRQVSPHLPTEAGLVEGYCLLRAELPSKPRPSNRWKVTLHHRSCESGASMRRWSGASQCLLQ